MPRWDARIEAAGKTEEQASQEAWLRWQADQLDADSRLTAGLLETEAAVEADRQAEREAWQAKQARMNQLGELAHVAPGPGVNDTATGELQRRQRRLDGDERAPYLLAQRPTSATRRGPCQIQLARAAAPTARDGRGS